MHAVRLGYSAKTAEQQGYRLLRNAQIQAATAKGREQRLARVQKTADDVVFLLSDMAFANRADIWGTREVIDAATGDVTTERYMLHPLDWPPALQRCIVGFEVVMKNAVAGDGHVDTVWKVKFVDPHKAAVSLGEHHGIFEKDREQASGLAAMVRELQERRALLTGEPATGGQLSD